MNSKEASIHSHPDECIPVLGFLCCDGGRKDYFQLRKCAAIPVDIQDCTVVAVSVAHSYNPNVRSPALSYSDTLDLLNNANRHKQPWKRRGFRESWIGHRVRRIKEARAERRARKNREIPKHQDAKYGVNTIALSRLLRSFKFSLVFGEPRQKQSYCLCHSSGTFVLDGTLIGGLDHSFVIIDGDIVADYDFRKHFDGFHVLHIWQRN